MLLRKMMVLLVLVFAVSACGGDASTSEQNESQEQSDATEQELQTDEVEEPVEPFKLLLLIPGTLGDKSFFDSSAQGIEMIKAKYGEQIVTKVNELSDDPSKFEPGLIDAAEGDWDMIMMVSWSMAEYLQDIAPQYPDKLFVICDTGMDFSTGDIDNVIAVTYKANEGSYLAGIVAAGLSESGHIGFLGGEDTPLINDFLVGYIEGAQAVNPEIKVSVSYVGNYTDSAKGKELALAQFGTGVDVGFNVAGGAGLGQIDAATELSKLVIGVDADQALMFEEQYPEKAAIIPTSMLKNVGDSLAYIFDEHMDGGAPWGTEVNLGLEQNMVGLADNKYYSELVPDDLKAMIKEAEEKIKNGETKVTDAYSDSEAAKAVIDSAK